MTHQEKVKLLITDLGQRGVSEYTVAPPLFRMIWKFGAQARPPHFVNSVLFALGSGAVFGGFMVMFMLIFVWPLQVLPLWAALVIGVIAGAAYGVTLAAYYRWQARKLSLPDWKSYSGKAA